MEMKQEKKAEKSPGQEQKDGMLQSANFAAGAERNGAKTADNSAGGSKEINLSNENMPGNFREAGLNEQRGKSMESKATNVPEAANKQKLKE